MKNIVWKMGNGKLAVTSLLDPALTSRDLAAKMVSNGDVPAGFTPVLFDVQRFPDCDAEHWRFDGATGLAGDPAAEMAASRSHVWAAIKAERERRKSGGVQVGGKWFHTDADSRIQLIALAMLGAGIPAGLQWKTMDGSKVAMTQTLAQQVFAAVVSADNAIFTTAETHRLAMEASPDPSAYNWHTGWPLVYGEAQP